MIRTIHLCKKYGNDVHALDDVNLQIRQGEFVFLMGKSGAGKSTLLGILSGRIKPTSGKAFVHGRNISRAASGTIARLRRQMGIVVQDLRLLERWTVYENIAFAMRVLERTEEQIAKRVPEVLESVGLLGREGAYPGELSGGERQRVAIARAIVNNPMTILADEPVGNLDLATAESIITTLESINSRGATVLVATHNEEIVRRRNHRVIYLERGRLRIDTGPRGLWGGSV
ncbi:MAG: ATP-binding cassette domain-containing protein [Bacillota bacterium]